MRQYLGLLAMGVLGVAVGAGLMSLVVPASAAPVDPVDQLWQDVESFGYLYAIGLAAAQAGQLADLAEPVGAMRLQIERASVGPEVVAAVTTIRTAALAGEPVTDGMPKAVTTAKAKAGEGQMLELEGEGLEALCATSAIYEPLLAPAVATSRRLSAADLTTAVEARLRLEVFGADAGEQY